MKITTLYDKYFQKSKIFLYPLLGIKRGTSVVPDETYISLENNEITSEDMKLVTLYKVRKDSMYKNFIDKVLLKHPRMTEQWIIDENKTVFVFDFCDLEDDWHHFINGEYSKMSSDVKKKINSFFEKNSGNALYVNSYLYPVNHFNNYAKILDVSPELLKQVGQLCDKPDLKKETLVLEKANLENINDSKINC